MSEQVLYDNCMANTTVRRRTFIFLLCQMFASTSRRSTCICSIWNGVYSPDSFENPCSIWLKAQKALGHFFFFLLRLTFLFDNQGRNKIQQQSSEHIIRCRTLPELWSHVFTPQASSEIFQASLSSLPVPLEYIYWWVREFQLYGKIKTKQLFFFPFCKLIMNAQPSTHE